MKTQRPMPLLRKIIVVLSVTTSLASAAEPDCVAQDRFDVSRIDKQIVLVGEAHGTNEIPAFTAGLVCSLLKAGKSVILGIEHSGEEQAALNAYMESAGSSDDRRALMRSSANWRLYSDGRGSVAMLEMIDAMRRLRKDGQRVGMLAFQRNDNVVVPMDAADRVHLTPADNVLQNRLNDVDMADSVLYAALLYRRYVVVVLAGYSHTSTILSRSDNPMFGTHMPMGQLIVADAPVYVIGIESGGGEHAATTAAGSKVYPMPAGPLYEDGTQIDATVRIDRFTPSMPARDVVGW